MILTQENEFNSPNNHSPSGNIRITNAFKDVYHARWGIEELYKVSKHLVEVDDFHGRSERGVKQELFAHFVLITLSRLCANASEDLLSGLLNLPGEENPATESNRQVNFKNTLTTVARHLEEILYAPSIYINQVMTDLVHSISRDYHKKRKGRHFIRESKQPAKQYAAQLHLIF